MLSAYRIAMEKIEQARAIISGEVWHDDEIAMLFDLAEERLQELYHGMGRKGSPENVVRLHPASSGR